MTSKRTIRISTIPSIDEGPNPYLKLFYQGLRPYGIEVVGSCPFTRAWLRENREHVDLIHFHWEWGHPHLRFLEFAVLLPLFVGKLIMAKRLGYRIVWTLHDFFPPHRQHKVLQYLKHLSLAHLSDGVFVNFRQALNDVHRWFLKKEGLYHVPHGNYRHWYTNTISKEEARRALGLPAGAFIYLAFGAIRPNRGIEMAVEAFQGLTSPNAKDACMLIVGPNYWGRERRKKAAELSIKRQIGLYTNIRRVAELVRDDEVQYYFNASDVIVLPNRYIYTSGSALLALTFARPIIAPRMGNLIELVNDERLGILFEPRKLSSLKAAMKLARDRFGQDSVGFLRQECKRYDWENIWPIAARSFREVMSRDQ